MLARPVLCGAFAALCLLPAGVGMVTSASASTAQTAYTYTKVSIHHGSATCTGTELNDINNAGTIVGDVRCGNELGLIRTGKGAVTLFHAPGPKNEDTSAGTITSNGLIAVTAAIHPGTGRLRFASYVRHPSGSFTTVSEPKASKRGTLVTSVNSSGTAVGVYLPSPTSTLERSFIERQGHYTTFALTLKQARHTYLTTINDHGELGGFFADKAGAFHGFIVSKGKTRVINAPGARKKRGYGTELSDLTDDGSFVVDISQTTKTGISGLYRGGHFTSLQVPSSYGAGVTLIQGVDSDGTVVGTFYNSHGVTEGIIGTP